MDFKIGDYVTRNSYNNDIIFRITDINGELCELMGFSVRLVADSNISDLVKCDVKREVDEEEELIERVKSEKLDDRSDYFYLPGKILHIDGDNDYLFLSLGYEDGMKVYVDGKETKPDLLLDAIIGLKLNIT